MKDNLASSSRWQILNRLYNQAGLSRVDLAEDLGVSKSTISKHISDLLTEGICCELGEADQPGQGRKRTILSFCADYRYLLLLDFGQVQPHLALTDLYGVPLAQLPLSFNENTSQDSLQDKLLAAAEKILGSRQLDSDDLAVLAVAAPGIVDLHGQSFYADGYYAHWDLPVICHELAAHYGLETFFYNDVNAAAWGEYIFRQDGRKNLVYMAGGSGLGLGLILNGELYLGSSGGAGEISNLLLAGLPVLFSHDTSSLSFVDADYIPFASRASIRVLLKELNRQKQETSGSLNKQETNLTYQDFYNLWKMGDSAAHRLSQSMGETLGIFLYNLSLLLDIDHIVLDPSYQPFAQYIDLTLKKLATEKARDKLNFTISTLGEQASLSGLADLAMETLLARWA